MEWLQLVYRVPAEPSRKRAYIWRQLRGMGAVYLQDACCVLPRTEEAETGLAGVAAKVREFGGEATLSVLGPAEPGWAERMVATLNRARDEEYEELLNTVERFEDEIARETRKGKFTFAALEEVEDEYTRLKRWLARVRARDPFDAPSGRGVEAELERAREVLEVFTEEVHRNEGAYRAGERTKLERTADKPETTR
ncbi:MAG: ChrB domain-containing protein [Chloroflexi bacterium]|nr:ChrB domain-containing protein [Chloroflexota bacterium]